MFQLTINEKGGQSTAQAFDKNEITIGRVQGNDVVLPKGNISKRHSRIVLKDGKFIIVDLKSTNGTYVNGKKITAPQVIKSTDKIYIGDYTLQLSNGTGASAAPEARDASKATAKAKSDEVDLFGGDAEEASGDAPSKASAPGLIDENFDQEFDLGADAPKPTAKPAPSASAAKNRPAPAKAAEPEPPPADAEQELDLGADFPADDDDDDDDDEDDEEEEVLPPEDDIEEEEPEPEPEPPKAPVVAAKAAKKAPAPAPAPAPAAPAPAPAQARGGLSKAKPATATPPVAAKKAPVSDSEISLEADFGDSSPSGSMEGGTPPGGTPAAPAKSPAAAPQPSHPVPAPAAPAQAAPVAPPASLDRPAAIDALHRAVVDELGLRTLDFGDLVGQTERATECARRIAARWQALGRISRDEDLGAIAARVAARSCDLESILDLLQDEKVLQIAVTADRQIWAEREAMEQEGRSLQSEEEVIDLVHRLAVLGGARPGPDAPLVDVRLRDGSRVIATLPPLAFRGPTLTIRKATRDAYNLESFVEAGTLSDSMMKFIDLCVRVRKNMLLAIGPGVTATATLNAVLSQMGEDERVVTIENGIELHPGHLKNVTSIEPVPGLGLGDLVRHAMATQPDRLVIGSVHGAQAAEVLSIMSGPLDGCVAACFASSPGQALDRLAHAEMARAFPDAPQAARRLVATAFPVILQEHRFPEGGSRRITAISELVVEKGEVTVNDIFVFRPEGLDDNGVLTGSFSATGYEPRFVQELVDRGDEIDMDIFKE